MSKYFTIIPGTTVEDLRRRYKVLCKQHHPDLGGNDAVQAQVNIEYQQALRQLSDTAKQKNDTTSYERFIREMEQHWLGIVEHIKQNEKLYTALLDELKNPIIRALIPQKYSRFVMGILSRISANL